MKFVYSVEREVESGFPKVFVPEHREFRDVPLSHGMLDNLNEAENIVEAHGGEVIKLMTEDAYGLPCCVRADAYPNGIID